MIRRFVLPIIAAIILFSGCDNSAGSKDQKVDNGRYFPSSLANKQWLEFQAAGYDTPAWGVIYNSQDELWSGMPLGGLATGCLDIENNGTLGYCTVFSHVYGHDDGVDGLRRYRDRIRTHEGIKDLDDPSRGKMDVPFLGLSVGDDAWVMTTEELEGVKTAKEIEYWGHFPAADLEFALDGPVQPGLRTWAPFIPGDKTQSNVPGAIFEVNLRNTSDQPQAGTLVMSFPGPRPREIYSLPYERQLIENTHYQGCLVATSGRVGYVLAALGEDNVRVGDGLGNNAEHWAAIGKGLPDFHAGEGSDNGSASVAVDYDLEAGAAKTIRFVLAWYAPQWHRDHPYDGEADVFYTKMYTKNFDDATAVADFLAGNHKKLLHSILAWQSVIYQEEKLPGWLKDGLINTLHLLPECGFWAVCNEESLGNWCAEGGLYSLVESTVAGGQQSCIPCDWYGNLPLVYFFPEVADTTLRAFAHYMREDGAIPFDLGVGLGLGYYFQTDRQRTLNGCCFVDMVGRLWLRTGDDKILEKYYPTVKHSIQYMQSLVPGPASMISTAGDQWYECMAWPGMSSHVGGVRLATLRIAKRMADKMGDEDFSNWCQEWTDKSSELLEHYLWAGTHYMIYNDEQAQDPSQRLQTDQKGAEFLADVNQGAGEKCELVLSHQLDGEWIADLHGVSGVFPKDHVDATLKTISRINEPLTEAGLLVVAGVDGTKEDKFGGRMGGLSVMPASVFISAMNFIYEGDRERGLKIAHDCLREMVCEQGMYWDMPNVLIGSQQEHLRVYGTDYYQCMSLWGLPAALKNQDITEHSRDNGFIDRIISAGKMK